jgi:hypothetical protein
MGVYLTTEEMEALFDREQKRLKHRDINVYLYLRSRMDKDSLRAVVGWKTVAVATEELAVLGSTELPFKWTRKKIRGSYARLIKVGVLFIKP